ncbi:MAG: MFS transporter [archaeon]
MENVIETGIKEKVDSNDKIDEEKLKEKARKTSIKEGCAYCVSDGFGFRNVTPYALAIGADNAVIGLLSSVPSLIANLSQLFTAKLMKRYTRKQIVVFSVFLQALMWLFLLIPGILFFGFAINSEVSSISLVFIYTLLVLSGAIAGPPWQSWMKDITPKRNGNYFGRRNRICGFVSLAMMLVAGFILDYFKQTKIFLAFVILFFVSFVFRSIGGLLFVTQYEPKFKYEASTHFSFLQFLKKMPSNNFGRFVMFISFISLATAIASPFFAVYMLKERGFSYVSYMIIALASTLTGLVSMTLWGNFADKYGNLKLMKICGTFVFIMPFAYLSTMFISSNTTAIIAIFCIEAFSGFVWGGFNLASGNFIYDAVTDQRLPICASYFNIINGFGAFVGATVGGLLGTIAFDLPKVVFLSSLAVVFVLSGFLRLGVYLFMIPKLKEVRDVDHFDTKKHIKEKLSILNPMKLIESLGIGMNNAGVG